MNQFINRAKELSEKSNCLKIKCGAVLVLNDEIIGEGWNDASPREPYCPRMDIPSGKKYFYCHTHCGQAFHAETMALYNRKIDQCQGSEMYIYGHRICCSDCMEAMKSYGVVMVVLQHNLGEEEQTQTLWIGND